MNNNQIPYRLLIPAIFLIGGAGVVTYTSLNKQTTNQNSTSSVPDTFVGTSKQPELANPIRPYSGQKSKATSNPAAAWISRKSMTASAIELKWSTNEGVAESHIHRIKCTSDSKPDITAMTNNNLIHTATEAGSFTDLGVEAGSKYWYGIRGLSADGDLISSGWHKAAAVDDEEPPSVVDGITATAKDGNVTVSWEQPTDNYKLHGYRIFRGIDGETPKHIAATWKLEQTTLIDDQAPTTGRIVYEIVAIDFHWNKSEPGRVEIDL